MVATSLVGVVSIRLVRTLCPKCKVPYEVEAATLNKVGGTHQRSAGKVTLYKGEGCPSCRGSGYAGRLGIFEVLEVTDSMRSLIARGAPDNEIRTAAIDNGMVPIGEDGLSKAIEGRTTVDEVSRVVYLAEQELKVCPGCTKVLSAEYDYCPACGVYVSDHCERCRRRVEPDWIFCPGCGSENRHGKKASGGKSGDSRLMPVPVGVKRKAG